MRRLLRILAHTICIASTLLLAATAFFRFDSTNLILFGKYEFSANRNQIALSSAPQIPQFEARLQTARKARDQVIAERHRIWQGVQSRLLNPYSLTPEQHELMAAIASESLRLDTEEQRARNEVDRITLEWFRAAFRWSAPTWIITLILATTSALTLVPIRLTRRKSQPGHCPRCNYDLRATPTRCPECGMIQKSAQI